MVDRVVILQQMAVILYLVHLLLLGEEQVEHMVPVVPVVEVEVEHQKVGVVRYLVVKVKELLITLQMMTHNLLLLVGVMMVELILTGPVVRRVVEPGVADVVVAAVVDHLVDLEAVVAAELVILTQFRDHP